jgi:hypothetical protein
VGRGELEVDVRPPAAGEGSEDLVVAQQRTDQLLEARDGQVAQRRTSPVDLDLVVVEEHEGVVGTALHVELHEVDVQGERPLQRRSGVLEVPVLAGTAAVRADQHGLGGPASRRHGPPA